MVTYPVRRSELDIPGGEVPGKSTYLHAHLPGVERYRPVSGYTGLYEVSDLGTIRQVGSSRVLGQFKGDRSGHLAVDLRCGGRVRRMLVHRLVALAWVPVAVRGLVPAHISPDIRDNRAANLEWLTPRENAARWFVRRGGVSRNQLGQFT